MPVRSDEEMKKFLHKMAREEVTKWVDDAVASLERDLEEMKRYRDRVKESLDTEEDLVGIRMSPTSAINSFVHMGAQVGRNMRLDLAVDVAVKLATSK